MSSHLETEILAQAAEVYLLTDEAGKLLYVSPSSEMIFGRSPAEVLALAGIEDVLGPLRYTPEELESQSVLQNIEWTIDDIRAGRRALSVTVRRVAMGAGTRLYSCREVTEQAWMRRHYVRLFLESATPKCIAGFDGYFRQVNPAFQAATGYSEAALLASPYLDFVHPDDVERTCAELETLAGNVATLSFEDRHLFKDGSVRWWLWNATPAVEDGILYASAHDITDRKRLERRLSMTNSVSLILGEEDSLRTAMPKIIHELGQQLGARRAEFSYDDERHPAAVWTTEWSRSPLQDELPAREEGVVQGLRDRIRQGLSVEWTRLENPPLPESAPAIMPEAEVIAVGFPVCQGNHLVGTVIFEGRYLDAPDEETQRFFRGFGHEIGQFIERKRTRARVDLLERAIESIEEGLLITDPGQPDNPIIYVNPAFERITGYRAAEAYGRNCRFLQGERTDPAAKARLRSGITAGVGTAAEILNYRADGIPFWNYVTVTPIRSAAGNLTHFLGTQRDVTLEKAMRQQQFQRQRLESIGLLAGGVAHDFNNLLTAILGFSEILMNELEAGGSGRELCTEIHRAGKRAQELIEQLLAFSRKQVLQPVVLELNELVQETVRLLTRLIPENIRIQTVLAPQPVKLRVDPAQMTQVIMNLVLNARDAMPAGGVLTIETLPVTLEEKYVATHGDAHPGEHVLLAVTDTGHGMTEEVRQRAFEPFFTTKMVGKGSGMGLATVYGIIHQSGGHITIDSEVGQGTSFKAYLPAETEPVTVQADDQPAENAGGTETILVVEDHQQVRDTAAMLLRRRGYHVLLAESPEQALEMARSHSGPIHLLLTDVIMPQINGPRLADLFLQVRPDTKVLFMSGYTDNAIVHHGILDEGTHLLPKPFTEAMVARAVRRLLDAKPADPKPDTSA